MQARIANTTKRNNALFLHVIGVRYETTLQQIEWLVERMREGLADHPKVEEDENLPRVRLAGFGASSIDIEARAYVETTSAHEFAAVQADLLAMIMRTVEAAGTSMAFPSTTAYLTRDEGIPGPGMPERSEAGAEVPQARDAEAAPAEDEQAWDEDESEGPPEEEESA